MQARGKQRRRHSEELKARVLAESREPGASVAAVALAYGLNANLVHKWRREGRGILPALAQAPSGFMPVGVLPAAAKAQPAGDIRVELKRGALVVSVSWPAAEAAACAQWLGEVLG